MVYGEGALPMKVKLLIAMSFDAAHGAPNGVRFLAQSAMNAGATKDEIAELRVRKNPRRVAGRSRVDDVKAVCCRNEVRVRAPHPIDPVDSAGKLHDYPPRDCNLSPRTRAGSPVEHGNHARMFRSLAHASRFRADGSDRD
jgi:hypothetical protein